MALPTINDIQAVEPILNNLLVGYMQNDSRFLASRLFPAVPVDKDSGTYYIVTKKYFFFNDLAIRAPGAQFTRLDYGVSTATYTTQQRGAEHVIPDEIQANSQLPMSLRELGVRRLAQASLIRKEVRFSTDFMANSVWGTTDNNSTTDWDDFAAGDPANDVLTAKRTISNNTGVEPNTMAVGYIVHQALAIHPDILDRYKYVQGMSLAAAEAVIGAALGVENYWVGKATYSNTNEAATFSATAIIDDDALICYVDPAPSLFSVTAGLTFSWPGGGGMGTLATYRDQGIKSDVIQHVEQWDQATVATDVGYIFLDVV